MPKITSVIDKANKNDLEKSYIEALKDETFKKYVKSLPITEETLMKYTSRLDDNCKKCPSLNHCQNERYGYCLTPHKDEKTITFYYQACPYLRQKEKDEAYQQNIYLFDIPKQVRTASMKDIYKDDSKRMDIIKYLVQFCKTYTANPKQKGLYLNGSFGSGKTYLIAALFNELAKNGVSSALVYYPELLRTLKESFGDDDFQYLFNRIKKAPLLLLDDIGAENVTPWSRDEILGTILQYRMDEELPTFFTSNLTLEELEQHLASSSSGVDKVKARRIIERIKQLTTEMKLVSKNRRN